MKIGNYRLVIVAGLAGALAAAVGCGSSGSSTDSGAKGGTGGGAGKGGSGGGTGGGSGGAGGGDAAVSHMLNRTFLTDTDMFVLSNYCEPDPTVNFNLAGTGGACGSDAGVDGGGADAGAGASATLVFNGADGSPDNGSLKITATFTGYKQYVDVITNLPTALNLSGRTLHANVKLVSPATGFPGGIQFHANTGMPSSPVYGQVGSLVFPTVGTWGPIAFPLTAGTPAGFDPTMVVQVGIQVYSGDAPATGAVTFPITIVFGIDTVTD